MYKVLPKKTALVLEQFKLTLSNKKPSSKKQKQESLHYFGKWYLDYPGFLKLHTDHTFASSKLRIERLFNKYINQKSKYLFNP